MGKLTSKLKEKGIPESFYKGRNLNIENEAEIETFATSIDSDYGVFRQELAESGVVINVPQNAQGNVAEGKFGSKIAELKNAGASDGAEGKKILINN